MNIVHGGEPKNQRGVYSVNYPRKILFSETITFKTKELPRWKPKAAMRGLKSVPAIVGEIES